MSEKINVFISGGGTGGHIYPAIAVVQRLKNDSAIKNIYYVGCPDNMEKDIALKEGLTFLPVKISGMPRTVGLSILGWLGELFISTITSIIYTLKYKPDIILGTGGYVSAPALIAGMLTGVPYIIHDPDASPGIVNRLLASKATAVSIAFEEAKKSLKSKNIILNGNPIRNSFSTTDKNSAIQELGLSHKKKTLLVMGGSQGAKTINAAIIGCVKTLVEDCGLQVIHQSGKKNFNECLAVLESSWPEYSQNNSYIIKPYFDDMSKPLACADLAVSRAGSLSISELNLCGLPSILVPFPYAAADHQRHNARAMEKASASIYLEDADCTPDKLTEIISGLLEDEEKIQKMKETNKALSKSDSTENIVNLLKESARKR